MTLRQEQLRRSITLAVALIARIGQGGNSRAPTPSHSIVADRDRVEADEESECDHAGFAPWSLLQWPGVTELFGQGGVDRKRGTLGFAVSDFVAGEEAA